MPSLTSAGIGRRQRWICCLLIVATAVTAPACSGAAARTQQAKQSEASPAAVESLAYAEPGDESSGYQVETLITQLDNPVSLAIRRGAAEQGPWDLFISESGAARIIRWSTAGDAPPQPAVTGFPTSVYGSSPSFVVGPLGLTFLTRTKLAVGGGGLDDGRELVQVYSLPDDGSPVEYTDPDHTVGPVAASERSSSGEGNFYGLAATDSALFVASHGDDAFGWVLRAPLRANRLSSLQLFVDAGKVAGTRGPTALTVNPKPDSQYLAVGHMGRTNDQRDSVLAFHSPYSGELAMATPLGLWDVTGLAYSPSGDLYAVDFSWADASQGGVYRIDAAEVNGKEGCRPVLLARVERPTALLFAPDGSLFVTSLGERNDPQQPPSGSLLRIVPGPDTPRL